MNHFDVCVITAANEAQATGYETQVQWRKQHGLFPDTTFWVIPDPEGKRIGSGGSTFYTLDRLYQHYGNGLFGKRVLILHSGGDSRRLPAFAVQGKLFTPLPTEKHHSLFDIMMVTYSECPAFDDGQVIIASGDVVLNFESEFVDFAEHGITGVAYPESPEEAQYYGVYVMENPRMEPVPVTDFLQKPAADELTNCQALDYGQRAWIDTGIINLAPDAVKAFLECEQLIRAFRNGELNYNLYQDVLFAVLKKNSIADSDKLWRMDFQVSCLPYCGFYHIGKSEEMLHNFYTLTHAGATYTFRNRVRSNAGKYPALKSAWVYNSVIHSPRITVNSPAMIEGSLIESELVLEGDNLLTGLLPVTNPVHLNKGIGLAVTPLANDLYTAIIYGINDHFKNQQSSTFLNEPMKEAFERRGIRPKQVWHEGEEQELWTARLFPACSTVEEAVEIALNLQYDYPDPRWHETERLSMKHILVKADHKRICEHYQEIQRQVRLETLADTLTFDSTLSFAALSHSCQSAQDIDRVVQQLYTLLQKTTDLRFKARLLWWLAHFYDQQKRPKKAEETKVKSFSAIRKAVARGMQTSPHFENPSFAIRDDEVVWTVIPARLDFAGGWTDTPPICLERGGSVLNASVTLNGQYPIQVIAKRKAEPVIEINSIDLGQRIVIKDTETLKDYTNPADWLSLPKSAFFASGLLPVDFNGSLADFLKQLGGGIDLTLFSALPSGSGLGTSSLLGAGLIATLARLVGYPLKKEEIYARTSNLEQLLTTGGGWQDQVGGVAGGVKLVETNPGFDQTPHLSWTNLKHPEVTLEKRFLLYYTGVRRMAKNLLRQVVGHYLEKQAKALDALSELDRCAHEMKDDLDHRDIDAFGRKIARAWELNKTLDQGQTTDVIEGILSQIKDYILGAKLLGAGGGGFLFIVAKDADACQKVRQELQDHPPNNRARFFTFDIDPFGLRISVL